ncbi:MAG: hypothetical protein ACK58H_00685, partial [Planctomyces sp.]
RLAHQITRPCNHHGNPATDAAFFRQLPQGTSERQPDPESRSFEKLPPHRNSWSRSVSERAFQPFKPPNHSDLASGRDVF